MNSSSLDELFSLEGPLTDRGEQLANAIDALLMRLADGEHITDSDIGVVALEVMLIRSLLQRLDVALLEVRRAPSVRWEMPV